MGWMKVQVKQPRICFNCLQSQFFTLNNSHFNTFSIFFYTAMFLCFGYNIVIIGSLMAFVTNDVSSRKSCLRKQWRAPLYIKRWPAALILPRNPPVRLCNEWREGDTCLHQNLDLLYLYFSSLSLNLLIYFTLTSSAKVTVHAYSPAVHYIS